MKKILSAVCLVLATAPLSATIAYLTTITFEPMTLAGTTMDNLRIYWTTDVDGAGDSSDLLDLSFSIYNEDNLVYVDNAMSGGVGLPIQGTPQINRGISDIEFIFDTTSPSATILKSYDNDSNTLQQYISFGLTYNLYGSPYNGVVAIHQFVDGEFTDGNNADPSYEANTVIVPEPSTYGLVAGVLALGLLSLRRKRT